MNYLSIIKIPIDNFKRFLLWDKFPLVLAVLLFFGQSLDFGMTYHVFINYPETFFEFEANHLVKRFIGTNNWWIWHMVYPIGNTFFLGLVYLFNPKNQKNKNTDILIRFWVLLVTLASFGTFGWLVRI